MGAYVSEATRHEPVRDIEDVPVRMARADLKAIPEFDLPEGHRFRWFEPGDDATWMAVHEACEGYGPLRPDLFERDFGRDLDAHRRRLCFIDDADGRSVATAAAWFDEARGPSWGRVHWVAVDRRVQGRGLAKPLMSRVCARLAELGHDRAYLTTNSVRIRAISLYSSFGFVPDIGTERERRAWDVVGARLRAIGKTEFTTG
jgi:GNAT superfamily N-acetyltransferase